MTLTPAQVEDVLLSTEFDYDYRATANRWSAKAAEYAHGDWGYFAEFLEETDGDSSVDVPDLGTVTGLIYDGGHEGHGEFCEMVFKVVGDDGTEQIFKKTGHYASWAGTDWDGRLFEVKATEKTVTVYEEMK